MTWLLIAAMWAGAEAIGSTTAVLGSACLLMIGRLADDRWLRPLVPVSIAIAAGVIMRTEAWGIAALVLIVLPLAASALTTIADRRLHAANG